MPMKRIILFIFTLASLSATAQQTYYPNNAPAGTSPTTLTVRYNGLPSDSLRKLWAVFNGTSNEIMLSTTFLRRYWFGATPTTSYGVFRSSTSQLVKADGFTFNNIAGGYVRNDYGMEQYGVSRHYNLSYFTNGSTEMLLNGAEMSGNLGRIVFGGGVPYIEAYAKQPFLVKSGNGTGGIYFRNDSLYTLSGTINLPANMNIGNNVISATDGTVNAGFGPSGFAANTNLAGGNGVRVNGIGAAAGRYSALNPSAAEIYNGNYYGAYYYNRIVYADNTATNGSITISKPTDALPVGGRNYIWPVRPAGTSDTIVVKGMLATALAQSETRVLDTIAPITNTNIYTSNTIKNVSLLGIWRGGLKYFPITSGTPTDNQVLINTSIGTATFSTNFSTSTGEYLSFQYKTSSSSSIASNTREVATYADMVAYGNPTVLTVYKVASDENKSYTNSTYLWWPNGKRVWVASTDDN